MRKLIAGFVAVSALTVAAAMPIATSTSTAEAAPVSRVDFCLDPVFLPNFPGIQLKIAAPAATILTALGIGYQGLCVNGD